jgi:hypothetical protein
MMTLNEAHRLLNAAKVACPNQRITPDMPERWRELLHDVTFGDCMKAVVFLADRLDVIEWSDIADYLSRTRSEPGGDVYFEALARRGGKEYTGGPVCWDPANCEGTCRECRAPGRGAS